ncbi:class I SAM-dependent methyltransferase [Pseudooctadecabacter sp.]|uniref:class I SAM-dependent methyltransferase n=1 Tax=Pseudooctadecabacter sp. TaxID=1966338 RepID=UPI0025D3DF9D|nr:class I SAM-dependent methyltransferase [Pseudooctadecabacter sp.]
MSDVQAQYEAFPYPERDPADEARRLITGSPSDPREMDHFLWGGQRDWSRPLRVLCAGGGTGDGLIQLAQVMTSAKRPYEIVYLDMSQAARRVAEARAAARGLTGITFVTGSLLDAAEHGVFDYIDCCGVLHHLPDPAAGFAALRAALAPGGGLGFMVYAPYGRAGVYPLQEAFGALFAGMDPAARLTAARAVYDKLPEGHVFKRNPHVVDHEVSDAGFYDLLLHSQDRAFDVASLLDVMGQTGWDLAGFCKPAAYDPARFGAVPDGMDGPARWAVAEKLSGSMKVHVGYARAAGGAVPKGGMDRIPHLHGLPAAPLVKAVQAGKALPIKHGGETVRVTLPKGAAPVLAGVNGRRSLAQLAKGAGLDPIAFHTVWGPVEAALCGWGLMLYSNLLKGR